MSNVRNILIVDDNEEQVAFLSQILDNNKYQYAVARDGVEALAKMQASPPALVLLDIMMPRKSGVNVFQQMKKSPDLASIPVIIITGASQVLGVDMKTGEHKPKGKESYEDDFSRSFGAVLQEAVQGLSPPALIEKPIDPPALIAKIRELLP
jgi:CheY-like chemotaxis protein